MEKQLECEVCGAPLSDLYRGYEICKPCYDQKGDYLMEDPELDDMSSEEEEEAER